MHARLYFQDPTDVSTSFLPEVVVECLERATVEHWQCVVAFATAHGIRALLEEPVAQDYLREGHAHFVVGLDAITLPEALDVLAEAENRYPNFTARAFENDIRGLFHPKLMRFRYEDGSSALVVGSGNLTDGGLSRNFEAFVVVELEPEEVTSEVDDFLARHDSALRSLDARAYELAEQNRRVVVRRRADATEVELELELEPDIAEPAVAEALSERRVLVAEVPYAGDRWRQVGLNERVVDEYFRIEPNSPQRLRLRQLQEDGTIGDIELRGVTMSAINRNRRLEVGARRTEPYTSPPPILVYCERGVRQYDYMLLFPGEAGYAAMADALETYEQYGRGASRVRLTIEELSNEWPNCPLLEVA